MARFSLECVALFACVCVCVSELQYNLVLRNSREKVFRLARITTSSFKIV